MFREETSHFYVIDLYYEALLYLMIPLVADRLAWRILSDRNWLVWSGLTVVFSRDLFTGNWMVWGGLVVVWLVESWLAV